MRKNLDKKRVSWYDINYLDNLFRKKQKVLVQEIISLSYEIEAYSSLAHLIRTKNWCLPEYLVENHQVSFQDVFHPGISNPVGNNFSIENHTNVIFLTGPNMAGKSSLLKAVAISVYLAHLGFPVPAKRFRTSIFKGLVTTINLPDDIHGGLSHFYNEVKRLRKTADLLLTHEQLFVVFDELFRGTNLKDAFDATLLLTSILAKIKKSKFVISSHFTEVVADLKKLENIAYYNLDCQYSDDKPIFSFKLKEGVSDERLGMYILKNEGVFSKLENVVERSNQ